MVHDKWGGPRVVDGGGVGVERGWRKTDCWGWIVQSDKSRVTSGFRALAQ